MKSSNKIFIIVLALLCLVVFSSCARFLNTNTVFAPENFKGEWKPARTSADPAAPAASSAPAASTTSGPAVTATATNVTPQMVTPEIVSNLGGATGATGSSGSFEPVKTVSNPAASTGPNDTFNVNFDCPTGQVYDTDKGKCKTINATEVMFVSKPTSTSTTIQPNDTISPTTVQKLSPPNANKYVDNRKITAQAGVKSF